MINDTIILWIVSYGMIQLFFLFVSYGMTIILWIISWYGMIQLFLICIMIWHDTIILWIVSWFDIQLIIAITPRSTLASKIVSKIKMTQWLIC